MNKDFILYIVILLLERMVLKREQFNLERIATKNTAKILRFLTLKPYLTFGLTELSEDLTISKSNVLRILKVLRALNLVIEQKAGKKKLFRINSEMSTIKILWNLFMSERRYNLPTSFKKYYKSIAKITLGEVESLLHRRSTIPKREIEVEDINIEAKIKILEEEIAREGERIWRI